MTVTTTTTRQNNNADDDKDSNRQKIERFYMFSLFDVFSRQRP
jgi:hypothetical protein